MPAAPIVIAPGDLVIKDPAEIRVYKFDWLTANIPTGVTITTSTFTITAIQPSQTDAALTKDQDNLPTNGCIRLTAGTVGQVYEIANKIVTNETPTQTKERSFLIKIENT